MIDLKRYSVIFCDWDETLCLWDHTQPWYKDDFMQEFYTNGKYAYLDPRYYPNYPLYEMLKKFKGELNVLTASDTNLGIPSRFEFCRRNYPDLSVNQIYTCGSAIESKRDFIRGFSNRTGTPGNCICLIDDHPHILNLCESVCDCYSTAGVSAAYFEQLKGGAVT